MTKKPVAIVLGGTIPHTELINNLKKRGYYAILIDYLESPPAANVADLHIRESTLDMDLVLQIAIENQAKLVISTCIDQAGVTACYVAEKLNLPAPYSYETALKVTNKTLMKEIMSEYNIPTSKFCVVSEYDELSEAKLKIPLVVKPADSNSSKGVRRCDNVDELKSFLEQALKISRNDKAVVEEFVEGKEIGLDCFITHDTAHIIMMHQKRKPSSNNNDVMYSIGSISPPEISETAKRKLIEIVKKIASAFRLKNTPLLLQTIVNGEEASVVEFSPRIGGGLNFRKIRLFTGFDIIDAAVDSYLCNPVTPVYTYPDFFFSENHIYAMPGLLSHVEGHKSLLENNTIEEVHFNKSKGMQLTTDMASSNRVGSFIVKAKTIDELRKKIRSAIDMMEVYNVNGQAIMKKEIYLDLLF
jgi:biotin carboxylase